MLTLIDALLISPGWRRNSPEDKKEEEKEEKEEERSRGGAHGTCLDFEGGAKLIGTSY